MSSASPLEVIAQGTSNGTHGALVSSGVGAVVGSPGVGGTTGSYTITCDPGVQGDNASALRSRVVITLLGSAAGDNVTGVTKALVAGPLTPANPFGGQLQISFTINSLVPALKDGAFDFIIFRDPTETTAPGT